MTQSEDSIKDAPSAGGFQPATPLTPQQTAKHLQVPGGHQAGLANPLEASRTYVFPGTSTAGGSGVPANSVNAGRALFEHPRSGGHSRSISHGEGSFGMYGAAGRPSALKSAVKGGHQRALSQGQIMDSSVPRSGHSRVGSKTDFILPPGHKEPPENREAGTASTSAKGHSRQASRSESIYTLRRADRPPWWKRLMFCRSSKFEDRGYRIVVPNHTVPPKTPKHDHPNGRLVGNKIRTTKYTLLSFVPKNLLEQFHRVTN